VRARERVEQLSFESGLSSNAFWYVISTSCRLLAGAAGPHSDGIDDRHRRGCSGGPDSIKSKWLSRLSGHPASCSGQRMESFTTDMVFVSPQPDA
jgi:hypothetical protein